MNLSDPSLHQSPVPVVWSIAGSDSGAGAGVQADLRAFDAFDVHGCTVVAAVTAQNSMNVEHVEAISTELLDAQLAALARDTPPRAIKTGLLGSAENARCVATWVQRLRKNAAPQQPLALVIDPVWRASTGACLSNTALRDVLLHELLPLATLITPNRAEAAWLLGWEAEALASPMGVIQAAAALRALGPQAVVITGGDAGGTRAMDWMLTPHTQSWLSLPRVHTPHHHGSGCVFAASASAALALGFCAADAVVLAKMSSQYALSLNSTVEQAGTHKVAIRGAGAVRPRRGFGLQPECLPLLHDRPDPPQQAFAPLLDPQMGLYAVVDSAEWVERVLAAGVRTVQLRIKEDTHDAGFVKSGGGASHHLSEQVARSVRAARQAQAQLFINDHWQLAIEHGAYGVHLGQEDLVTADMAALRSAGLRLGLSTHSPWEVCRARAWQPSYIACGPIHATTTKTMPWLPQGPANLAYWCQVLDEPVVAIAGMDVPRSLEATRCGAAGVAVLRGITQAMAPEHTIQRLQTAIATGGATTPMLAPELPSSTLVCA
jgi:hydroxymethylpyrimidine kinase / phosphomethylpyrimidine kinase / thiamine-phosphate diphosphorylase